jgi:hypothetical protein
VITNVRLVSANKIHMGQFVRYDAKQVVFYGLRVEIDYALPVVHLTFAQLAVWRALNFDRPPFTVQFETKRRTFAALFHLSL